MQKLPPSAEVEAEKEINEHNFSPGEVVEVSSDEEGFEGAWFTATVVKKLKADKYFEYQTLRNDDDTNFLREEVDTFHIRPCPPDVGLLDRFEVLEEVDALYNDGWWRGVISKVLKNDRYSVYFRNTQEELKFKHSDLRVHQDWVNGKWVIASKCGMSARLGYFQKGAHCFLELHIWSLRKVTGNLKNRPFPSCSCDCKRISRHEPSANSENDPGLSLGSTIECTRAPFFGVPGTHG
ncbi:protein AGENET DOMAIN (AGD)-CONTAINING P1 [Sesamum angolense]|uniref:Protein AGENET DOMAIN (AGD)-CONTAINING P1 n=1 Tax=Sesamum angolense TaxID=2727404 RepID=A0AAE1X814_9LAMI|nr:protein AGENET DOMAIN (AGD)-CONTAINING P1 [Sesamum angolense]